MSTKANAAPAALTVDVLPDSLQDVVHDARDEQGTRAGRVRAARLTSLLSRGGSIAALLLVCLSAGISSETFARPDNLRNVALSAAFIGIIAAGMTFVIVTDGIDLSVGSVYALGVLTSAYMSQRSAVLAIVVPLLACGGVGLVQGGIIARWNLPPFLVTLAGMTGVRGLVYYITSEGNEVPKVPAGSAISPLGQETFLTIGLPVWFMLAAFAAGAWLLNRTAYGQHVQAVGGSASAAQLMGLPVRRTTASVYLVSGLCAGLSGILTTALSNGGQEARIGDGYELVAIAAVVIGGTLLTGGVGSMVGSLAGILLWFVIANIVNQSFHATPYDQQMISGGFLLVVVVLQAVLARRATAGQASV